MSLGNAKLSQKSRQGHPVSVHYLKVKRIPSIHRGLWNLRAALSVTWLPHPSPKGHLSFPYHLINIYMKHINIHELRLSLVPLIWVLCCHLCLWMAHSSLPPWDFRDAGKMTPSWRVGDWLCYRSWQAPETDVWRKMVPVISYLWTKSRYTHENSLQNKMRLILKLVCSGA